MCDKFRLDVEVVPGEGMEVQQRETADICSALPLPPLPRPKKMALDWKIEVGMEVFQTG